ncbi:MAG: hypothetical protein GTN38_03360 [Candidatus Aenigmarchaeota archaeon]|nr:hypothetical protein [Candidatus Aenigmarchaeota archaeon]NIP40700.1 hypothetical protein [Candidatus Aenigmarchaeota archaeon]NIQ18506.1 hypothetical protein [Candidatus Aenigmarchaeota archaeon]NIS73405.1 hypothetical protein [Candidatus Aenigmarchaeota archaeon]
MDGSILSLLEMLPQLLNLIQIVVYVILAWFFGAIAMKGLRKHLIFPVRMVLTFCVGFFCLISGIALSDYIFFLQDPIFALFQLDITVGGLLSSLIFAVAFYLISRKAERMDPKTLMKKLKNRVGLLEGILLEHKVPPIREEEAKKRAEKLVPGYQAREAKLNKTDWEVFLWKEKRKAKVIMGAYDGETKIVEHDMSRAEHFISDPLRIIGIGIIIFILGFSLINFKGFPNMTEGMSSMFGIPLGGDENLPEGCVSASMLALKYNPKLPVFEDESVRTMIESETGTTIQWMYRVDYEGADYILAIDSNFENICSATENKFCNCMEIPLL